MDVTKLLDPVTTGPSLPSKGVLAIAGLVLLCLALMAALVLASTGPSVAYTPGGGDPGSGGEPSTAALGPATLSASAGTPEAPQSMAMDSLVAVFPAEAQPIPTEMITRIEEASEEPLEVELGLLLEAIQIGFSERSTQLEPTLRPYLFRIAGRLSVRSDSFRVAVTAPDESLARARAVTLRRLFDRAGVLEPRVILGAGSGPHAITLVSDSSSS